MKPNRREFLQIGAAAALRGAPTLRAQGRKEKSPNILVIMTDEHNPRVTGAYGNRIVSTPNIDQLAASGITFESNYCNSPLCVPSRLSFTTGKYIHRVSAWNNDCRLPNDNYSSLPHVLNAAGYQSFLCGKQHYDAEHRYGFTEIGGNMNPSFMTGRGNRRQADDTTVNERAGRARFAQFHTGDDSIILNHDRRVTAGVVDFLSKRGQSDKPFFLFAGYLAPHFPLIVPEKYWQKYRGRIPMPAIPEGFLESPPLNYKHLRRGFGIVNQPPDIVQRGRELYYGLTEWVDNEIGTVLAALRKSSFADNTIIVYTADHGENMGEHGLWWKNAVYEQAAHVPLIINWPKRWRGSQRRREATSGVDVVRTIAEFGGGRVPGDWDGQSMLTWMDDPKARWRDMAISQYYAHNIASGYAMLRTGEWKYVYHSAPDPQHKPERELYNLTSDQKELRNLATDPAQRDRVAKMHAQLLKELGESPDETELRCRAETQKGYGRTAPRGKRKPDEV
jgi:choline-sulfatase